MLLLLTVAAVAFSDAEEGIYYGGRIKIAKNVLRIVEAMTKVTELTVF